MSRLLSLLALVLLAACSGPLISAPEVSQPVPPTANRQAAREAANPSPQVHPTSPPVRSRPAFAMAPPPTAVPTVSTTAAQAKPSMPAMSAQAKPTPVVDVTHVTDYQDSRGYYVVQGFVENTGTVPAVATQVAVTLLASNGQTVGAAQAQKTSFLVPPGGKVPWVARIECDVPYRDMKIEVNWDPVGAPHELNHLASLKLEGITVASPAAPHNRPKISGHVVNTAATTATHVVVTAVVYDEAGEILVIEDMTLPVSELAPEARAPFEVDFQMAAPEKITGRQITKYDLFVDSQAKR